MDVPDLPLSAFPVRERPHRHRLIHRFARDPYPATRDAGIVTQITGRIEPAIRKWRTFSGYCRLVGIVVAGQRRMAERIAATTWCRDAAEQLEALDGHLFPISGNRSNAPTLVRGVEGQPA